jgi:hypothetical protein
VQLEIEECDLALQQEGAVPRELWLLSTWFSAHTIAIVVEHVCLGFRLELYQPAELHSVFWQLYSLFGLSTQLFAMVERGNQAVAEQQAAQRGTRSKGWAKRNKALDQGGAPPPACRAPTPLLHEGQRELCRGLHLLISGLIKEGVISVGDGEFISLRERFNRRFSHLRQLVQPAPPRFEQYEPMLSLDSHTASALYSAAARCLKACRAPLEAVLKWPHCAISAELEREVRAMIKAAVVNGVAACQLELRVSATPPGEPPKRVAWQAVQYCDYPALSLPSRK